MTTDDENEESSESDDENHQQRNELHQNEPLLRNRNSSYRNAFDSTDSAGGAISLANHLGDCFLSLFSFNGDTFPFFVALLSPPPLIT